MKQEEARPGTQENIHNYSSAELFIIGNEIQLAIIRSFGEHAIKVDEWVQAKGARFREIFDKDPQGWAQEWKENPTATATKIKDLLLD